MYVSASLVSLVRKPTSQSCDGHAQGLFVLHHGVCRCQKGSGTDCRWVFSDAPQTHVFRRGIKKARDCQARKSKARGTHKSRAQSHTVLSLGLPSFPLKTETLRKRGHKCPPPSHPSGSGKETAFPRKASATQVAKAPHSQPTPGCRGCFNWSWCVPTLPLSVPKGGSLCSATANSTGNPSPHSTNRAGGHTWMETAPILQGATIPPEDFSARPLQGTQTRPWDGNVNEPSPALPLTPGLAG